MVAAADRARITTYGDACRIGGINQVVPHKHIATGPSGVLACRFDAYVCIVDQVTLEYNFLPSININPVCTITIISSRAVCGDHSIGGIEVRGDVVYRVPTDSAIPCLVIGGVWRYLVSACQVDPNIVVVVDNVIGDHEAFCVTVQRYRLTAPCLQVVNLVSANDQIIDWAGGLTAIYGNAEGVSVAATGSGHNVMDVVVE